MISNIGSSAIDSISECVTDDCDDKESVDAVGDDMVVIDGVMVSAQELLGDTPEFQPLRQNIPVSRLRTYSISTTLHTFPHTEDDSIIHT